MPIRDVSDRTIAELISLKGRSALVTGAAKGIGRAISARLAEAGATVVLGDIDHATAKEAAAALTGKGHNASAVELDVTDQESIDAAFRSLIDETGTVDILVNNAGIYPPAAFIDQSDAHWRRVFDVNVDGAMRCARAAAAVMAKAGTGVIVNVSSIEGEKAGAPGISAYVASKHAMNGLTKSMAVELGPSGIRVLGVAPTVIITPGFEEMLPIVQAAGVGDLIESLANSVPLGRAGQPDDVARIVLVAVSDLAMLMTGSTLLVDAGGMYL
jgi:NAD(P)-dependent dehydrogenase (short-subunit alcohol dehydrogenase family)